MAEILIGSASFLQYLLCLICARVEFALALCFGAKLINSAFDCTLFFVCEIDDLTFVVSVSACTLVLLSKNYVFKFLCLEQTFGSFEKSISLKAL